MQELCNPVPAEGQGSGAAAPQKWIQVEPWGWYSFRLCWDVTSWLCAPQRPSRGFVHLQCMGVSACSSMGTN